MAGNGVVRSKRQVREVARHDVARREHCSQRLSLLISCRKDWVIEINIQKSQIVNWSYSSYSYIII